MGTPTAVHEMLADDRVLDAAAIGGGVVATTGAIVAAHQSVVVADDGDGAGAGDPAVVEAPGPRAYSSTGTPPPAPGPPPEYSFNDVTTAVVSLLIAATGAVSAVGALTTRLLSIYRNQRTARKDIDDIRATQEWDRDRRHELANVVQGIDYRTAYFSAVLPDLARTIKANRVWMREMARRTGVPLPKGFGNRSFDAFLDQMAEMDAHNLPSVADLAGLGDGSEVEIETMPGEPDPSRTHESPPGPVQPRPVADA